MVSSFQAFVSTTRMGPGYQGTTATPTGVAGLLLGRARVHTRFSTMHGSACRWDGSCRLSSATKFEVERIHWLHVHTTESMREPKAEARYNSKPRD